MLKAIEEPDVLLGQFRRDIAGSRGIREFGDSCQLLQEAFW